MEGSFPNYTSYLLFVDLASLSLYLLLYSLYLFYPSVLRLPLCFTFCTSLSFFSSLSLCLHRPIFFVFSPSLSLSLSFFFSSPLFELCLLFLSFSLFSLFFSLFSLSLALNLSLSLFYLPSTDFLPQGAKHTHPTLAPLQVSLPGYCEAFDLSFPQAPAALAETRTGDCEIFHLFQRPLRTDP